MAVQSPFLWGSQGQKKTPEQIARERELLSQIQGRVGDTSPVDHWLQGAGRVVDAITGKIRERRADASEEMGMQSADDFVANNPVLSSLINGSGSGVSMGVPSNAVSAPSIAARPEPNRFDQAFPVGAGGPAPEGNIDESSGLSMGKPVEFDLAQGITATAEAIGADPLDLATAISYETAGTFDPTKAGPTTQWGQHRGLIQFGEPQAQQYGVDFSSPDAALASQLGPDGAIAKYFTSSGFQPGMSGLDLYSTINAGAPGKYNASDANNGGAPGSVADKWQNQMADHRAKAQALLGGSYTPRQGGSGGFGGGMPQQDNSGVISALASGMADPWVAKKYGPVLQALMGQQMKRGDMQYQQQLQQNDPAYQLGVQKAQIELDQMRNPAAPAPVVVGGVLVDPSTGREIYDSRQPEPGYQQVTPEEAASLGLPPGAYQRGADGKISQIGGSGVTVNNNMGADAGEYLYGTDAGVPAGWRVHRATGEASPIPGGPVAVESEQADSKSEERDRQSGIKMGTTLENIGLNIDELEDGGVPVTGVIGKLGRMIPGSQATDFANRTTQINTRAALDEVQNMRDNSPTGGAVGQLTDSEREAIGLAATSLANTSSKDEYLRSAKKFRKLMLDTAHGEGNWRIDDNGQLVIGEGGNSAGASVDVSSDTPPPGLDDSDADLWKYATPEERQAIWGQQ